VGEHRDFKFGVQVDLSRQQIRDVSEFKSESECCWKITIFGKSDGISESSQSDSDIFLGYIKLSVTLLR